MTSRPEDRTEVVRLVTMALDMRERGIEPPLAELCGSRQDLVPTIEQALRVADRLPALGTAAERLHPFAGLVLANRYHLHEAIGAGSMGLVYRGEDRELGRTVAVKILRSDLFGGEEAQRRFTREAEVLASLNHPTVVSVHDRGSTDEGLMYLVMELVEGVPLDDVLRAGEELAEHRGSVESVRDTAWLSDVLGGGPRLETGWVRQCARWACELAEGLRAAHDAGVFHRDVKPSNVIIRRDGSPVLIDFGIAALGGQATSAVRGQVVGTPAYMAPERLSDIAVTPAVDVYGLAATLYSALTLQPPYRGTSTEVMSQLSRRDPVPARAVRSDLPRDLVAILDTGMAREPARRYGSAGAFRDDLRALLEHRPVAARPIRVLERGWRRARRSREVRALSVAGALGAVVLAVALWTKEQRAQRQDLWLGTWQRVPPTLCIAPASMRRIEDAAARAVESDRLDLLVETSDHPVPSRVVRAAFRLDHGDRQGAAEDFAAVAEAVATPVARALAQRYAELGLDASDVPIRRLPEPETSADRYLVAFHVVRHAETLPGAAPRALELLTEDVMRDLPCAAELSLVIEGEVSIGKPSAVRQAAFRALHGRSIRLEGVLGRPTATTSLAAGVSLLELGRGGEAVEPLVAGVELSPSDHSLRIGLARALGSVRRLDEARAHLEHALRLRPASVSAHRNLVELLGDLEDFEAAARAIHDVPFPGNDGGSRARSRLLGRVRYREALWLCRNGEREEAARVAGLALRAYADAGFREGDARKPTEEILACQALATGDFDEVFVPLVDELARSPGDWKDIENVADLMPLRLQPEHVEALRRCLRAFARHASAQQPMEAAPPAPFSNPSKEDPK